MYDPFVLYVIQQQNACQRRIISQTFLLGGEHSVLCLFEHFINF